MHKGLNVLKNIFFEALGPKYGFLKFQKMELSFSYFLHEIALAERIEIELNIFLGKKMFLGFWTKKGQNRAHKEDFQVLWEIHVCNFSGVCLA